MTISELLGSSSVRLSEAGVEEPSREAATLLIYALNRDRSFLIAHPEYEPTNDEATRFDSFITRRASREPFHYITGLKEFYGLDFAVTPDVLIPRPETEILVEAAIKELQKLENPKFCEIGVGSGCISVSILHHVPTTTAIGIDISEKALAVARRNADHHAVADRLSLQIGDVFAGVTEKFDMIVSNPPYIPDADLTTLQPEVRDHEPHLALFSGSDGLDVLRRIVADAPKYLKPSGLLLMEIGFAQWNSVGELFNPSIWRAYEFLNDMQGIPRIVKASTL